MARSTEAEILKRFADIAALGGVSGQIDAARELFVAGFELSGGRSQVVFVRGLPEGIRGRDSVRIFSPARRFSTGFIRGISKEQAIELLRMNAQIPIARFELLEHDGGLLVVASVDALLDTLDNEEVESCFWAVALAADGYEKKFGGDHF